MEKSNSDFHFSKKIFLQSELCSILTIRYSTHSQLPYMRYDGHTTYLLLIHHRGLKSEKSVI